MGSVLLKKVALGVGGVGLIVLVVVGLKIERQTVLAERPQRPRYMQMGPFSFVQSRDGAEEWRLTARRAHTQDRYAHLEDVRVVFHSQSTLHLHADAGQVNLNTRDFSLLQRTENPVTLTLDSGHILLTPELFWKERDKTLISKGQVRMIGPMNQANRLQVVGNALFVNLQTQTAVISGNVEAVIDAK